jgi:hypothetical protein
MALQVNRTLERFTRLLCRVAQVPPEWALQESLAVAHTSDVALHREGPNGFQR